MELTLGLHVSVQTRLGASYTGVIFACDSQTQTLILDTTTSTATAAIQNGSSNADQRNFVLLALSQITSVQAVAGSERVELPPVGPINWERLQKYEQKALDRAKKAIQRVGVGVSLEGQEIFYEISKTLPAEWDNDVIVIFKGEGAVTVRPPYDVTNCQGDPQPVSQVRKIIDAWNARRTARSSSSSH